MALFRVRTAGERFRTLLVGAFLAYVSYWAFEVEQPQVGLVLGALGVAFAFMSLWKFEKVS